MANEDVIINVRVAYKKAQEGLKKVRAEFEKGKATLRAVATEEQKVFKQSEKLNKALGKSPFQGWALSIMFFGMAMQRIFSQMWQFGTKTFNDIMHSVEGTVTQFDILNGSMTYLGFVIGQALEPVAAFLWPIIDFVSDWIAENSKLFATILIIVGVLGTVMMVVGFLVLGVAGLIQAFAIIGPVATGALAAIASVGLWPILAIIGAIILIIALWKTNFGGFKDFVLAQFSIIGSFVKSIWGNISGIFSGFVKLVKGIFTGDIDMVLEGAKQLFFNFIGLIAKAFLGIGALIVNVFKLAFNLALAAVSSYVKLMLGLIAKLADKLGLEGIAEKARAGIEITNKVQDSIKKDYITGDSLASGLGLIDKYTNPGQSTNTTSTTVTNNFTVYTNDSSQIDNLTKQYESRTP